MIETLQVQSRQDRAELVPLRFGPNGSEHDVAEILDRWPGEDHQYFKVRTTDGDSYILRYDAARSAWEISVFKEGDQRPGTVDSTVD